MQTTKTWAVIGVTILLTAGCAIAPMPPPVVDSPRWPRADSTWAYEERNTGSLGSGMRQIQVKALGEQMWEGRALLAYNDGTVTSYWTARGEMIAIAQGRKPIFTYDPFDRFYDWPLAVGKAWIDKGKRTDHTRKQTLDYELHVRVEAYEDVVTQAGSFKAFKIVLTSAPQKVQFVNWWSHELGIVVKHTWDRFPGNQSGEGRRERVLVSHDIKR